MRKFRVKYYNGDDLLREEDIKADGFYFNNHGFLILYKGSNTSDEDMTNVFVTFYSCKEI